MIVVPITIRRLAPRFRLPCSASHNRSCIVGNFVDNKPNVLCIYHTFSENLQKYQLQIQGVQGSCRTKATFFEGRQNNFSKLTFC
jgi:hypothetical protein